MEGEEGEGATEAGNLLCNGVPRKKVLGTKCERIFGPAHKNETNRKAAIVSMRQGGIQ